MQHLHFIAVAPDTEGWRNNTRNYLQFPLETARAKSRSGPCTAAFLDIRTPHGIPSSSPGITLLHSDCCI